MSDTACAPLLLSVSNPAGRLAQFPSLSQVYSSPARPRGVPGSLLYDGRRGAKRSRLWAVLSFVHVAHPVEESAVGRKVGGGWKMQLSVHCHFHYHLAVEIIEDVAQRFM